MQTTLRVDPALYRDATAAAAREGVTLTRFIDSGTVDAWIAAHAIALNAPLVSFDRGFVRYTPTLQLLVLS